MAIIAIGHQKIGAVSSNGLHRFKEDTMLHRFDMSLDEDANRLSIKEFAVIGPKLRKSEYYDHTKEIYSLINEVSYDGDIIRAAIKKGQKELILELRSDYFFPILPWIKTIAEQVTLLFNGGREHFTELFFDDRTLLPEDN